MKLIDLLNAQEALSRLMDARGMSGAESYGVARLYNTLKGDIEYCVNKYNELVRLFGEESGQTGRYSVPEEKRDAFGQAFRDAFDVPLGTRFERAELRGSLELGLSPREMSLLEPFVRIG